MATQINIHEAKTHLSQWLQQVQQGEEIVIAKAGKPLARLVAYEPAKPLPRLGFLQGQITIPEDFDSLGADEVRQDFEGR